jgi:hypothetical protein
MTQRITAGEGSGKMKKLYMIYCLVSVCASFVIGIVIGMVAMLDFITDEYIVIDPEKLKEYQQIHHPIKKNQGLTT